MAKPEHVDKLYESVLAQPRKLTARERRRVLVYIEELGDLNQKSNYELASMFQVSEAQIRDDRKRMLVSLGEELTAANAMALVARYDSDVRALIKHAYRGLNESSPGGPFHRNYLETLAKLTQQQFNTLQEIGVVRKELGHMAVTHEDWEATISDDMIASVGPVVKED